MGKNQKDIKTHKELAAAGGFMVLSGVFALAAAGIGFDEALSLKNTFYAVSGTMLTGGLNGARNLGQWYLFAENKGTDLSAKPSWRQKRRWKQACSNFVSAATNIPQLAEGVYANSALRILTAGSAVLAYGTRAGRYGYAGCLRSFGLGKEKPGYLSTALPADMMVARGTLQTVLGVSFVWEFNAVSGAALITAGVLQTKAALSMRSSDKPYHLRRKSKETPLNDRPNPC